MGVVTFLKLYKWYQIAQSVSYRSMNNMTLVTSVTVKKIANKYRKWKLFLLILVNGKPVAEDYILKNGDILQTMVHR